MRSWAQCGGSDRLLVVDDDDSIRSTVHTDDGHWMVASDGAVFASGDCVFRGSTTAVKLSQPTVGMAGGWLVPNALEPRLVGVGAVAANAVVAGT